jgi:hypothetical protein
MSVATHTGFTIHFPDWYDELAQEEFAARGYLPGTVVELADGSRYELYFYDPVRLAQNLDARIKCGIPCTEEANLVVIFEITPANVAAAIARLVKINFFQKLKPLDPTA